VTEQQKPKDSVNTKAFRVVKINKIEGAIFKNAPFENRTAGKCNDTVLEM
jgi:hypothetical protein